MVLTLMKMVRHDWTEGETVHFLLGNKHGNDDLYWIFHPFILLKVSLDFTPFNGIKCKSQAHRVKKRNPRNIVFI